MSTRNTVQSLSVTRGPATSTITVDYGISPPRVTVQQCVVGENGSPIWRSAADILPDGNGQPARWSDPRDDGVSPAFGRDAWGHASHAEADAFELATRRWRVFNRRMNSIAQSCGGGKYDRNNNRITPARKP
jgi:hypothetical protein